jgi:hypothetical protein
MTPKQFAALAAAAAVSLVTAIVVYTSSVPWTRTAPEGVALFESLRNDPPEVGRIEVVKGDDRFALEREGDDWLITSKDRFPAAAEKVRAFLLSLSEAELVEAKTNSRERYALLSVENPKGSNPSSHLVRLIDTKGKPVAEIIVGKTRPDAFGLGKGGTYVRRPDEAQSWLVNTEINAGTSLRDWVRPQVFEARRKDIERLTVEMPDKENLDIALSEDGNEHLLQDIPEGMKVRYANTIDDIAEAARSFDFDDIRKRETPPTGDKVSAVTLELANGLKCLFRIRRDGGVAWLSIEASGDGEAAKEAEELNARTKGWEFRIPKSKADAILKDRAELLEKIAS